MEMNNDQEFVIARLKKEVFDVTEQNIWRQFEQSDFQNKTAFSREKNVPTFWGPIDW